ncbi:hypothetical protein TNCV_4579881 [Trichonephila clavipes]|nr:hypothetical protein TNCV_4579881 [Trichonephila clavipes]
MNGCANGNGRAALRIYQLQFPDQQMMERSIFQWLHHQFREALSLHVTRHDAGRRRAVPSSSLEESILNIVADIPESSTRAVAHHLRGILATDHVNLNHGQVTWKTPELAPPFLIGLELVSWSATIRYLEHSATTAIT